MRVLVIVASLGLAWGTGCSSPMALQCPDSEVYYHLGADGVARCGVAPEPSLETWELQDWSDEFAGVVSETPRQVHGGIESGNGACAEDLDTFNVATNRIQPFSLQTVRVTPVRPDAGGLEISVVESTIDRRDPESAIWLSAPRALSLPLCPANNFGNDDTVTEIGVRAASSANRCPRGGPGFAFRVEVEAPTTVTPIELGVVPSSGALQHVVEVAEGASYLFGIELQDPADRILVAYELPPAVGGGDLALASFFLVDEAGTTATCSDEEAWQAQRTSHRYFDVTAGSHLGLDTLTLFIQRVDS